MFQLNEHKILPVAVALAAICCLAAPSRLGAAAPDQGADITFSATGTFASAPVSGADTLKLAGQPFTISVVGSSSKKPTKHGRNWAVFNPLSMTGTVYSGLIPNQPIAIAATTSTIEQTVGASEDVFKTAFPVVVIGIALQVKAYIPLPGGTLEKALLRPFSSVTLDTSATVTYSNSTAATVLAIQSGTLVATLPTGGPAGHSAAATPLAPATLSGPLAVKPRSLLPVARA
jgi:hypothetical protein